MDKGTVKRQASHKSACLFCGINQVPGSEILETPT